MSFNKIRKVLYLVEMFSGDRKAVKKGNIGKAIAKKAVKKSAKKILKKLLK